MRCQPYLPALARHSCQALVSNKQALPRESFHGTSFHNLSLAPVDSMREQCTRYVTYVRNASRFAVISRMRLCFQVVPILNYLLGEKV